MVVKNFNTNSHKNLMKMCNWQVYLKKAKKSQVGADRRDQKCQMGIIKTSRYLVFGNDLNFLYLLYYISVL